MRTVSYLQRHADGIRKLQNPFADPKDMLEYALRDHIYRANIELAEMIESQINGDESHLEPVRVNEFLKKIPENLLEAVRVVKGEATLTQSQEEKVRGWIVNLAGVVEIGPERANYFWQKACSNCVLGVY